MERYYLQRWHLELNKDALQIVKKKQEKWEKEIGMKAEEVVCEWSPLCISLKGLNTYNCIEKLLHWANFSLDNSTPAHTYSEKDVLISAFIIGNYIFMLSVAL